MSAFQFFLPSNSNGSFQVSFRRCERASLDWKSELALAARMIANDAGTKPLWLCSSGGIDSEIMCQVFFDLGIHFSVLTVRHVSGTNTHDIYHAEKWCRLHGVPQKIVDIDITDFLTVDVFQYAKEGYVDQNVFRYFQIRLLEIVESMGGYAVLGGGEQLYRADHSTTDTFLSFGQGYALPYQWMKRNHVSHEPYFYFRTPELIRSYLNIPIVDFTTRHPNLFVHPSNAYVFKRFVLQSEFPQIEKRRKFNGFERILSLRAESEKCLAEKYPEAREEFRISIASLRDILDTAV